MARTTSAVRAVIERKGLAEINPLRPVDAVVVDVEKESYNTNTYTFVFQDRNLQERYRFRPGQFNQLSILGYGEAPISLSSNPEVHDLFQHTIRILGDVTGAVGRLGKGDVVGLRGPYGQGWPMDEAKGKDILVVAGGLGIAPLRPAIEYVLQHAGDYGQMTILFGGKTPNDLLYCRHYDRWNSQPKSKLLVSVDRLEGLRRPWTLNVGVVSTLFDKDGLSPHTSLAFIAGPEVMMRFAIVDLLKRGFPPDRLFLTMERRMECGIAQCGHCYLGPKYVCKDGPVFRYSEVRNLLPVEGI
ncbi:MAG: FAD/NAD(P)-binding protein [Chloroflexi bacterium]|nr:FAD/NAD(P)-binding protein [Chloroflexota bacterium]